MDYTSSTIGQLNEEIALLKHRQERLLTENAELKKRLGEDTDASFTDKEAIEELDKKFNKRFAELMDQTKPDGEESNGDYQRRYAFVHDRLAYSMQDEYKRTIGFTKPYAIDQLRNALFFLKQAVTQDSVKPDGTLEIAGQYIIDQHTGTISLTPNGIESLQMDIKRAKERFKDSE